MLSFVAMISLLASAVLCQPEGKEPKGADVPGTPEPKGGDMLDWDMFSTTPEPKGAKGFDNTGESMDDTDDSPDGTGEPGEKGAKGSKGSDSDDITDIIDDVLDHFNITLDADDILDHHHDHVHGNDSREDVSELGNSVAAYGVFTSFVVVALGWGVTVF